MTQNQTSGHKNMLPEAGGPSCALDNPLWYGCGLHGQVESAGIQEGGTSGVSHRAVLVRGAMLCFWLRTAHPGICKGTRHVHVKGTLPVTARLPSGLTLTPVTWPGGHCRMETTTWACRSSRTSLLPSPWCLDSSPRSARTHAHNKRDHMWLRVTSRLFLRTQESDSPAPSSVALDKLLNLLDHTFLFYKMGMVIVNTSEAHDKD